MLEYCSVWYDENKNKAVIITELLQGGNLREHRKYQKKLKIKLIKKWIKQILLALDFLHTNGFIHHDIKCQNILVDRNTGNLKIGDLISLEKIGEEGYFTKYIGTEEFMAVEVKDGKYTFKADIYSLGLTIIQFLTMERPYKEFRRKINLYEAKKNGKFPQSFNQIENKDIQDFISLCLKQENERPNCKELLNNKWLNDNTTKENNTYINIINNLRQPTFLYDNNNENISYSHKESENVANKEQYPYNLFSPFTSSNSLIKPKMYKQPSMGPIYSLDISKLNSTKFDKDKNKNGLLNKYKLNSFKIIKPKITPSIKGIKSPFSFGNLNDKKGMGKTNIYSDRTFNKKKYKPKDSFFKKFKERNDSIDFLRQLDKNNQSNKANINIENNFIIIYSYIIESDENLLFLIKENEDNDIKDILLKTKIIISKKKWKREKISNEEISLKKDYNCERENLKIIIDKLKDIILINKNDEILIKNILEEKIKKIIKEKKLKEFKYKINDLIRNIEFLINNDEFDELECLINNKDFCVEKLPKDINEKINYFKEKKINIENLFSLHNININEDYNNYYDVNCQDFVTFSIND